MASGGVARGRLAEERKLWRKSHPHGFVAKPETMPDGSVNLMVWKCVIPGKEGVKFCTALQFHETRVWYLKDRLIGRVDISQLPSTLLKIIRVTLQPANFQQEFFHVNVFDSGEVCLSILGDAWKPSITVRQILIGIQDLLDNPKPASPAQDLGYDLFTEDMPEYRKHVRQQAKQYPSLV